MKIHEVSSKSYPSMVAHPQILEYSIIMNQIIHSFESHLRNIYTFTTTVLMAIKLGRVVTYYNGLLTINSYNVLIRWFCKVT